MDERLLGIVKEADNIEECIDLTALKELTVWRPHSDYDDVDWSSVRHLYILTHDKKGTLSYKRFLSGINISDDGSWAMLYGSPAMSIRWFVQRCQKQLESLYISSADCGNCDLTGADNMRHLHLVAPNQGRTSGYVRGINSLKQLEHLSLDHIFTVDDLDLSRLTKLLHIRICFSGGRAPLCLHGIHNQEELRYLSLLDISWVEQIDVSCFQKLEELYLRNSAKSGGVCGISTRTGLKRLSLSGSTALGISDFSTLHNLQFLSLSDCPELTSLSGIDAPKELETLCIKGTGIKQIPSGIRELKKMKGLDLSFLELDELPYWLPELGLHFSRTPSSNGICLYSTTVKGIDMSIFDQPRYMILNWFESLNQNAMVPLQEAKVVFLGDGEAGKTHTIARLLNDGNAPRPKDFDNKATPGIVIKDKHYDLDNRDVNVHYWDFGGQEILHSMHRMFLTERTLYVVLINARDDTQDDRARYWLHNIRSFAGTAPVLLVLNKIDQNPNASINETELRELYSGLRRVVRLSAKDYSPRQFNTTLTEALMEEIRNLGTIGTLWPISWAKIKTGLQDMKTNFITGTKYKSMCRESGVETEQKELLHWFNDLGVSFCYQGSRRLENYVILRPEWVTNGIYILLFNKSKATVNGVIPRRIIYEMLNPKAGNKYRRVLQSVTYTDAETEYVMEVMRKFRLSYPISTDAEFIPALCQRDSMHIAKEYIEDKTTLEFQMTYDYLPDNVIHRLMVEMRQDLQHKHVWRTGALFRQPGTGLSAVVKSEGDVLRIFVRSENAMHRPNTYLCILKENIDRINREMKLAAPYAEVVYKHEDGNECFDYEDLLYSLEDGEKTCRSKKLRKRIPIEDILNQTGFKEEQKLKKLQENILAACMQLQGNPTYHGAKEDVCNTYLRDSLRNMGYVVYDQTFQGTGSGGKSFGELDLEIRQEPNIPWTILEALRITDSYKTTAWNRHLKKLLDNYNPSGLNHLFLLTYLHCGTADFGALMDKYSEHVKWYDPDNYQRLPSTFAHLPLRRHGDPAGLQVMRCTYDRSGSPTTVTHIFVRIAP